MSSHRAVSACAVPKAPKTTGTTNVQQCHMRLISARKPQYFANFSACSLPMFPSAGQLISIRRQGFDLPGSGDGCIPHHSNVICLHKPVRMMPVPSALHWNPKMTTNIPVNDGGHLIVSISVVHRCQSTTACYNVVDCFQAYTAHAAS